MLRPLALLPLALVASTLAAQPPAAASPAAAPASKLPANPRLDALKAEVAAEIQKNAKQVQEMVDMVFSFGELGFQEFETSKYLTGILEKDGFSVERGVAGMPTAWVAKWGSGKPVIALGSDLDGIPQSNQKPGVGYRDFLVEGAPGHGEGHNSGQAVNVAAALAVKKIMQREKMPGTIVLFPGVAEEQMAGKAFLVRAGVFKDVDATLFTHVGSDLGVSWGETEQNALISAEFLFKGSSAHAAGAPWRGKSALDAVMLMAQGWEFRREHLRLQQRSHYVIKNGGDQPNVVPGTASIWFYFRETDADKVTELFETGKRIAQGAAMMTDTKLDTVRILGSGWSGHFNKAIAETMYQNIKSVGLPTWDEKDQTLAKGIQRELGQPEIGLVTQLSELRGATRLPQRMGGGSDDIGDVSWVVPTVTLRFPSNIPNMPGHNWANGISMATPIGHKGAVAGAKVQAMTVLDLMLQPTVIADAWSYFRDVQTKETKYRPLIGPTDMPPTYLNADIMARYREQMRKFYYDPKKYGTYLEQLGITYPTVRPAPPTTPVVP
ncbi:MAG: amidohydrolase [Gemmatimonadaceae bacterium]|nr:amidohydrolase [Gemmatimonadaceae bacterium]